MTRQSGHSTTHKIDPNGLAVARHRVWRSAMDARQQGGIVGTGVSSAGADGAEYLPAAHVRCEQLFARHSVM